MVCGQADTEGSLFPGSPLIKYRLLRLYDDHPQRPTFLLAKSLQIDERRLLATRLEITPPEYVPVAVEARIKVKAGRDLGQVVTDVEKGLYRYINPVCDGPNGDGWSFGRSLSLSEIYATIQGTANVDYIEEVKLFPIKDGERQEATTRIGIPPDSLLCSHKHEIIVVE